MIQPETCPNQLTEILMWLVLREMEISRDVRYVYPPTIVGFFFCIKYTYHSGLFHLIPHLCFLISVVSTLIGFVLFGAMTALQPWFPCLIQGCLTAVSLLEKQEQLSCHEHCHKSCGIWNPVWSLWCVVQMSESSWVSGAGGHTAWLLEHLVWVTFVIQIGRWSCE